MKLVFISKSENESFARQAVCSFAAQLDPNLEELSDLRIVVSEAVTNCIVHAYKGTLGLITLTLKLYTDRSLRLSVSDHGIGMEDIEKCMEPLYTTDPNGERGGMGLIIMKNLSNDLKISSAPNKGTRVIAYFRLSSNT